MRSIILFCLTLIFASVVYAVEDGFTNYIIGISKPVTKEKVNKAKADVVKSGGKVLHEITLGMTGLVVALPSDLVQAFDSKDYVDFIEEDQLVHAFDG